MNRPRLEAVDGGTLYVDLLQPDALRFLVLSACAQCGDDALCNYLHDLGAAFCGPVCADKYRNGEGLDHA